MSSHVAILWRILSLLAGVLCLTIVTPLRSAAQLAAYDTLFPWPRQDGSRDYGLGKLGSIDVDPDLIIFDDTTRTATVTFTNPTALVDTLWLAPECGGDGKPQPHDPLAATWHRQYTCVMPWVSGYPQILVLAPHERQTLTLQLHPYPVLADGRYIGRLMINGFDHQSGHDETAIEYIKGPKQPRPARTQWDASVRVPAGVVVHAEPRELVLTDTTSTATVTLANPGAMATEVWLTMDCPWFRVHYDTVSGYTHKSQYEYTWHLDVPNMVTWLSGYPQHLVLAPHERRTITVTLHPFYNDHPPKEYPAGSYYAQLRYVQTPVLRITGGGRDTIMATPAGAVDIVYQRGIAATRQLVLGPLQYARHSDGTATACLAVQQPGVGFVATLQAKLRPNKGTTGKREAMWQRDTTLVGWEVGKDWSPVVPPPVCFLLPDVQPGHYTLALSVRPLGGETKEVTLPVDVP